MNVAGKMAKIQNVNNMVQNIDIMSQKYSFCFVVY